MNSHTRRKQSWLISIPSVFRTPTFWGYSGQDIILSQIVQVWNYIRELNLRFDCGEISASFLVTMFLTQASTRMLCGTLLMHRHVSTDIDMVIYAENLLGTYMVGEGEDEDKGGRVGGRSVCRGG